VSRVDRIRTPIVGVIPAAGVASRLQPIAGSKEILPVGGKPVIDYLVERMRAAGCSDIRVVTRPEKRDVGRRARELGARVIEARPATVAQSLAYGLPVDAPTSPVLFGFPDTIWEPVDGFSRLLDRLDESCEVVLGLFHATDLARSDVVTLHDGGRIAGIAVKPREPTSDLIWGCGVAWGQALSGLKAAIEPGRYFDDLARRQVVLGVELSDRWIDIGTTEALARARTDATWAAPGRDATEQVL
jgi:glucose-1-phosphate thymidylyltransferase